MLLRLSIRDIVLIERLDLDLRNGLCVFTGETGAGKSILLDALGLALGSRAEVRLVRHNAVRAIVTAEFDPPINHPSRTLITEHGLDNGEGVLVLRRVLSTDGRSRAFVNDQSASISLLRKIGETLIEIHGQFETQGLLNSKTHCNILDSYGNLEDQRKAVSKAYRTWKDAQRQLDKAEKVLECVCHDEEFLRHAINELTSLTPRLGEEAELAMQRSVMMHHEKLMEAMNAAFSDLCAGQGTESVLRSALHHLERIAPKVEGRLDEVIATLNRAIIETTETIALLEQASSEIDLDPQQLEKLEERLFSLRAVARKHNVDVDSLPNILTRMEAKLAKLEDGGIAIKNLYHAEIKTKQAYITAAENLGAARRNVGKHLDKAMACELPPLKMEKACFETVIKTNLEESRWSEHGREQISFQVATNPGTLLGPLNKIASGGELARFMLALKACLSDACIIPTLVFDEVDAGVNGAVADAVGERLMRLSEKSQILVVTHSPQVAARGTYHWRVTKTENIEHARTNVEHLDETKRREELARMLAGAQITNAARAAADSLLEPG